MRAIRVAVITALLIFAAASAFAVPCGYNPQLGLPAMVDSLSTNNKATFTSNTVPLNVQWGISGEEGEITFEGNTYALFTAPRNGTITIVLIVSNGEQTCSDIVYRTIPIVHPCTVTPVSRVITSSYAGGTVQFDVQSNCDWKVSLKSPSPSWLRVVGPASFHGNGTVTFQFDPLALAGVQSHIAGPQHTVYIGDKDVTARQGGWREAGTDFDWDGKADLLWRNRNTGVTWMQRMNGLTATTNAVIGAASTPFFPAPDWRILTAHTELSGWQIYWRNTTAQQSHEQALFDVGAGSPELIVADDANWRVLGAGIFRGIDDRGILRRNTVTGQVRISRPGEDKLVWTEPDANWKIVAVDDFDGDGHADIAWRHAVSGLCFMILDPEVAPVTQVFHNEPDLNWQIAAAGDVNADGRADLVWRNTVDGRVWIQALDGFRTVGGNIVWRDANLDWKINGMADFDGNGTKDLVWRNAATGMVFGVLLDRSMTVLSSAVIHNEPDLNWRIVAPNTAEAMGDGGV